MKLILKKVIPSFSFENTAVMKVRLRGGLTPRLVGSSGITKDDLWWISSVLRHMLVRFRSCFLGGVSAKLKDRKLLYIDCI